MRLGRLVGLALTGLLTVTIPSRADEEPLSTQLEGLYQGTGEGALSMTLINLEGDTFAALVTTAVADRCAGRLSGIGKLEGEEMVVENVESRDDAVCRLTISFANNGKRAKIGSAGQCTFFHGTACGFSGSVQQVVVPPRLKPKR